MSRRRPAARHRVVQRRVRATGYQFRVVNMWKLSPSLACGVFLAVGWIGVAASHAQGVPEYAPSKTIELAPHNSEEKTPVISSVALDPAGKFLAAVGDDHLVRLFDIQSGNVTNCWKSHTDWVKTSAFRPDGQVLATSGDDRRIQLWDVSSQGRPRELSPSSRRSFIRWPTAPTGECWRRRDSTTRCGSSTPTGAAAPRTARAGQRHPRNLFLARRRTLGRGGAGGAGSHLGSRHRPAGGRRAGFRAADLRPGLFARRQVSGGGGPAARGAAVGCGVWQAGGRSAGAAGRSAGAYASAGPTCWPRPAAAT